MGFRVEYLVCGAYIIIPLLFLVVLGRSLPGFFAAIRHELNKPEPPLPPPQN
jgi:hypothetical protein